jgi:hypothetical protein
MFVSCVSCVLCRYRPLGRAQLSIIWVLLYIFVCVPVCVSNFMWSRTLKKEAALSRFGLLGHRKKEKTNNRYCRLIWNLPCFWRYKFSLRFRHWLFVISQQGLWPLYRQATAEGAHSAGDWLGPEYVRAWRRRANILPEWATRVLLYYILVKQVHKVSRPRMLKHFDINVIPYSRLFNVWPWHKNKDLGCGRPCHYSVYSDMCLFTFRKKILLPFSHPENPQIIICGFS